MQKTFDAILKNNSIQWIDKTPEIDLDNSIKIQVTFLEDNLLIKNKSNGQKMANALEKIAHKNTFSNINPSEWQKEIRQERPLLNRD